jgi:hypothetical protein
MKRLFLTTLVGLTLVVAVSTSASAFQCLARGSNGVSAWGAGLIFERAQHFAIRHCRIAGGVDCQIIHCR